MKKLHEITQWLAWIGVFAAWLARSIADFPPFPTSISQNPQPNESKPDSSKPKGQAEKIQ